MAKQTALPMSLPPIGISREVAAAYLSISPTLFDRLVSDNILPSAKRIAGRLVWDVEELRLAFKALPNERDTADARRPELVL